MAFKGNSRTLTQQSSAASSDDLHNILFSPEPLKKLATKCDLGRHHWMRADNAVCVRPLVPETTSNALTKWFSSGYEAGELPSKGYMSVPQVLCAITRTVTSDAEGSLRIYLADLGDKERAPIDAQVVSLHNRDLPAIVSFHPTYDCPMEQLGGISRCFALVIERYGYIGHNGTTASVCSNWQPKFSSKNNNYKPAAAGKTLVLPYDRLSELSKPSAVARLLKSQLNMHSSPFFQLPEEAVTQKAIGSESEVMSEKGGHPHAKDYSELQGRGSVPFVVNGV
ncbi:3a protein [Gayfeather mild mottle virus]|uniref:Movement protein n=1 Tax=Gayfeather mild mottle virus TaxID=578305 RepID=C0MNB5_9BROM|nr:3a protein [Gayfeather mild mottle virus]CAT02559.1 3a protein [Gayfeather mild mottle virus]